jgi:hypothetical protein
MKRSTTHTMALSALAIFASGANALARGNDEGACEGKAAGDACIDADGDVGACDADPDGTVLECEDDEAKACEGKSEGDTCAEDDGDSGTCQPHDGELECED